MNRFSLWRVAGVGLLCGLAAARAAPDLQRLPTEPGIAADLTRVRQFLETAMPARIVDGAADRGAGGAFNPLAYETGVIHSGMLRAAAATGDRRFADFTAHQFQFIADALPFFRAAAARRGPAGNSFRAILAPAALDDCGAMLTAMIQARRAGVGPDLLPVITGWADYIAHRQFRMADGTLARQRPQPISLWSDDLYMGVPPLAAMGRLTGDVRWSDDAAQNAGHLADRLFRPAVGLYAHGWIADNPDAPEIYWARANGWAVLAYCDLLDDLPARHPARAAALSRLRAHLHGVALRQSGRGLWHQVLDREDSYLETSASAMFVYGLAHAINQGWISPAVYGGVALAGWNAVAAQINPQGQVENTCVGTTFASNAAYYYDRPVSVYAVHGYGPVLLAGAEMIRLLRNPAVDIRPSDTVVSFRPAQPSAP